MFKGQLNLLSAPRPAPAEAINPCQFPSSPRAPATSAGSCGDWFSAMLWVAVMDLLLRNVSLPFF